MKALIIGSTIFSLIAFGLFPPGNAFLIVGCLLLILLIIGIVKVSVDDVDEY